MILKRKTYSQMSNMTPQKGDEEPKKSDTLRRVVGTGVGATAGLAAGGLGGLAAMGMASKSTVKSAMNNTATPKGVAKGFGKMAALGTLIPIATTIAGGVIGNKMAKRKDKSQK